jgi:hypothetical protein
MPSRSQKGRSIGHSFDQQEAHKPADSPTTSRQAGQSGGSATSSASRTGARKVRAMRRGERAGVPTLLREKTWQERGAETFLLDHVAHDLAERLSVVLRKFELAADLGTPGDAVRDLLLERKLAARVIAAGPALRRGGAIIADEEALPFADASLDLAVERLDSKYRKNKSALDFLRRD